MSRSSIPSFRSNFTLTIPTLALLAFLTLISGCAVFTPAPRIPTHSLAEVHLNNGYRFERAGWIYVHIEGEPYDRGYQFGHLVAPELKEIQRVQRMTTLHGTGMTWEFFIKEARRQFAKKLDEEFTAELQGIADGARAAGTDITFDEVLAWNGSIDLLGYWWPRQDKSKFNPDDQEHCSAFAATGTSITQSGGMVMAHNTWSGYATGQYANLILDVKPARGHRILMQAAPGLIHSASDFAVSDAGIAMTETTIGGYEKYDEKGSPEFYRMRKAMQYADTMDDFVRIMLKDNNGGYANSWLLADVNTGEMMRFELGLKFHNIERTRAGYYIGFNGALDLRIRNLESGGYPNEDIRMAVGARLVRLTDLMEQNLGRIDAEKGKAILADHYDVYLQKEQPSTRTVDGHHELDPQQFGNAKKLPFTPGGSVDGKVIDRDLAKNMTFWARWGNSCGRPFDAKAFLKEHPQWRYLDGYLKDRPSQPWVLFKAGDRP